MNTLENLAILVERCCYNQIAQLNHTNCIYYFVQTLYFQ